MQTQTITNTITELCSKLGCSVVDVTVSEDALGTTFSVTLEGGDVLCERGGVGIGAVNHVVKRMVGQQIGDEVEHTPFSIDINGYQKQKNELLIQKARTYAERATSFGTEVELDPMNAYERMVVHNELGGRSDVETESRGVGRERHVVIKPNV